MDAERFFLENLSLIEEVVRSVGRSQNLPTQEVEDLSSEIKVKLVSKNYEVLRKFEGLSSFRTYIKAVVLRHYLDERNARWGKWRASMRARQLGPVAMELDKLLTRDNLSVDEAVTTLLARGVSLTREQLRDIAEQLPARRSRHFVGDGNLELIPSGDPPVDEVLDRRRQLSQVEMVEQAVAHVLSELPAADRLALEMSFCDNLPIAEIARRLHVDQKGLYRRRDRVLSVLRHELEVRGVSADLVRSLLGLLDFRRKKAL